MGCTNSKLQGDAFDSIDASKRPAHEEKVVQEPPFAYGNAIDLKRASEFAHTTNEMRETADPDLANSKLGAPIHVKAQSTDAASQTNPSSRTPRPPVGTTTSFDRANPPSTDGNPKKLSLYQRYTNARLGVGESRDPVTGKGLYTGMTKEEVKKHVYTTRRAGVYGNEDVFGKDRNGGNGRQALPIERSGMIGAFVAA